MNAETRNTTVNADFVDIARSIAKVIEAEADAIEENRELTPAVVGALREGGLFWMMVPKEMGGGGADLLTTVAVNEELARADGSTGWCFMANSTACTVAATFLEDSAVEQVYGKGKLPVLAGAGRPTGTATPVEGGIYGGGVFSFGSGSTYSDWVTGAMLIVDEKGDPILGANGLPKVRLSFVPRDKIEFLGNWDVAGLKGTGSVDFRVLPQFIRDDFALEGFTVQRGGSFYSLGMMFFALCGHASVALGLMKRALEEIVAIAATKRRFGAAQNVIDSPLFCSEFGLHEADYRAARAYLMEVIGDAQATASAGKTVTEEQHARLRHANSWAHATGMRVVSFCYKWAGADAVRKPSTLSRVMEDMRVANQHITNDPGVFAEVAPTLMKSWAQRG